MAKSPIYTQPSPTFVGLGLADLAPLTAALNQSSANMNVGSNSPNTVAPATPVGTISLNVTPASNTATTGINTLMTASIPANAFDQVGRGVHVKTWGVFAGNAQNKQITLAIGGITYATGSSTQSGTSWEVECYYFKSASDAQVAYLKNDGLLTGGSLPIVGPKSQTDTAVDTSAITVNVQATDGSGSGTDITVNGLWIQYVS